jgi:DNA-directed RNA polymerase beta' subunit
MKIITDINDANILLGKYKGGSLQISTYSTSLRRIAIKIQNKDIIDKVTYFVGVGCEHMDGYFDFSNIDLHIENCSKNNLIKLIDKLGNFQLMTNGGFTLAEGNEEEFNDTLEELIK